MNDGIHKWSPLLLLLLLVISCRSTNVNPADAKPNTGYVDLYSPADTNLCWEVKDVQVKSGKARTLFSNVKPVQGSVLRLALSPGDHRLSITFLNKAVSIPALLDLTVEDGRITPVLVTLQETGTITARGEQTSFRTTLRGVGQATDLQDRPATLYEISASAEPPRPYWPKEALAYSK